MDKNKFVWSSEKTHLVIEKQESYPELWDTSSKDYKNKIKKQNALKAIANDIDAAEEEVKRKLHNLRTQFGQEVNKERKKKSGQSADDVYVSKWEFYNDMKYMTSSHVPKETEDNLELSITLDNDANITDQSEKVQSVPRKRPKKTNSEKDEHDVVLENALQIMQKPSDEYQIFGDFVASELRGLRKAGSKRKLKRLIQQAILKVTDEDDEDNSETQLLTQLLSSDTTGIESSTQSSIILPCNTSTQLFICSDNAQDIGTEPRNIPTQSVRSYIQGFETDT